MRLRAIGGIALLASLAVLSTGTAMGQDSKPAGQDSKPAGQDSKPAEPAPPPVSEPAPPPAPPAAPLDVPPEPPPFVASSDVAANPVVEEPATTDPRGRRLVFIAGLGYTSGGSVKHSELSGNGFSGEMLELAGGLELSSKWHLTLSFTSFQTKIERVGLTNQFRAASGSLHGGAGYQPLVSCPDCITNGGQGGIVVKQSLHVHTLGPRLDYLPFGTDSLFVGVTAGAAMMQDLSFRGGVAVAARAGFEWRPYSALSLALEAGAHGQIYFEDSSAALPYAALQLRLLAPLPPTSRYTTTTEAAPVRAPIRSAPPQGYK